MPVPSKDKTVKIQYVDGGETMTGRISPVTMNFMENGYVVLKNFIPKEIITMTLDAWKVIENEETPMHKGESREVLLSYVEVELSMLNAGAKKKLKLLCSFRLI